MEHLTNALSDFRARHPLQATQVRGVQWTYVVGGEGPQTLLYLPGGGSLAEMAFTFLPALEQAYRVIAVNYPSAVPLETLVRGVLCIVEQERASQRIYVWGNSFGGMVAQALVRAAPRQIAALVLSNTTAPDPRRAARVRWQGRVARWLPAWTARRLLDATLKRQLASLSAEERSFWSGYLTSAVPDARAVLGQLSQLSSEFYQLRFTPQDVDAWNFPILIVAAKGDELYSGTASKLRRLYPKALVVVVPGGHSALLLQDSRYTNLVRQFFDGEACGTELA